MELHAVASLQPHRTAPVAAVSTCAMLTPALLATQRAAPAPAPLTLVSSPSLLQRVRSLQLLSLAAATAVAGVLHQTSINGGRLSASMAIECASNSLFSPIKACVRAMPSRYPAPFLLPTPPSRCPPELPGFSHLNCRWCLLGTPRSPASAPSSAGSLALHPCTLARSAVSCSLPAARRIAPCSLNNALSLAVHRRQHQSRHHPSPCVVR